jgi:NAD(P)-dependent dehydrogenase (short-subunit alcohol dehydrogenase family)
MRCKESSPAAVRRVRRLQQQLRSSSCAAPSSPDLRGKVALVTGGSRGIGREIAVRLAACGARVAVHFNSNRAAAVEVLGILDSSDGGQHIIVQAEISDAAAVRAMIDTTAETMGECTHAARL